VAKAFPDALVTAADWAEELTVARANAEAAGVADRFRMAAGNELDLDWGGDFDLILLPNFLHHFDFDTRASLLRSGKHLESKHNRYWRRDPILIWNKIHTQRLAACGKIAFHFTPNGDAYRSSELDAMAKHAGFRGATSRLLSPTPESLIIFEN
jgi:hypothetical protein